MEVLGIDIGGTGIKGAPVDTVKGVLLDERFRVLTPHPATPEAVADAVAEVAKNFKWKGRISCGFPAVVKKGVILTAANVDKSWVGTDAKALFEKATGCKTTITNDADAAGIAELEFGAGRGHHDLVLMVTLGTGIGTALFVNRQLVPNTELGHLIVDGRDAERRASDHARIDKGLSWKKWAKRVDRYLGELERLLWPDLIIIGGGASKNSGKFIPYLTLQAQVVPAQMLNDAGIVGAAIRGHHHGRDE